MLHKNTDWVCLLIILVVAFDLAYVWQWRYGAYQSEFGGHPDESAHVVTGLFVRDAAVEGWRYAMHGFRGSPIAVAKDFANRYYNHYPKIGLGVWPPFFYVVQSVWTLAFGASRVSLLLLVCMLAAALGSTMFVVLREEFGAAVAGVGAALLISLPLVREYYGMVMAETLSALLMFGAIVAFGEFLDGQRRKNAIRFGLLAALAILTKGTGLALILAAPLALVLTRKMLVLKRPVLWVGVGLIVILAGPWTWATRHLGEGGWLQPSPSWSFSREALPYYAGKFAAALGLPLLILFALGVLVRFLPAVFLKSDQAPHRGRWASAGALIISILIFQSIAPVGLEARHLIPALAPALMFVVAGFDFLASRFRGWRRAGIATVTVLAICWSLRPLPMKGDSGFGSLAAGMLADGEPRDVTLVSSDATGEGMFIAEVALHESRPGHVIQRASKTLATSTWSGSGYSPAFSSDAGLFAFLQGGEIRYLVVDDAVPPEKRRAHEDQLQRVIAAHPDQFQVVAASEITRAGKVQPEAAKLYKIVGKN